MREAFSLIFEARLNAPRPEELALRSDGQRASSLSRTETKLRRLRDRTPTLITSASYEVVRVQANVVGHHTIIIPP